MSFTSQDVVNRIGDIVGNYSTGQATPDQYQRAIDYAINIMKRSIGFPEDEKIYSFFYSADINYVDVPSDFQDFLGLYYNDNTLNVPGRDWTYRPYSEVLRLNGGQPNANTVSHTTINGSHQLLLWGINSVTGSLIESFDTNIWTTSGDASGNHLDTTVFEQGTASNNFTITYSTGTATLTSPNAMSFDASQLFQDSGNFNLYYYFSALPTSVAFRLTSSTGNYYTITVTNASGEAFALNTWNKLTFPTPSAVTTGSPSASNIISMEIITTVPSTFGTVPNMRVDNLYTTYPDLLNLIYYSNLKGTNSSGSPISTITATSDIILYDNDYIEPIATQAAIYLWPQFQGDLNYLQLIENRLAKAMLTYTRQWPRKRMENNNTRTRLAR